MAVIPIEQIFEEALGAEVFGDEFSVEKTGERFWLTSLAVEHDAELDVSQVKLDCRFVRPFAKGELQGQISGYTYRNLDGGFDYLKQDDFVGRNFDTIIEAYGLTRDNLIAAASAKRETKQSDSLTALQKKVLDRFLNQPETTGRDLLDALQKSQWNEHANRLIPESLLKKAFLQCNRLVRIQSEQIATAQPFSVLFEKELGAAVFGNNEMRLGIRDIRAEPVEDEQGYTQPGVKFTAVVTDALGNEHTEDVAVGIGPDAGGDRLSCNCKAQHAFVTGIETILSAYGYSRNQVLDYCGFKPMVKVPGHIVKAIAGLYEGVTPHWEDKKDIELWQQTLETIRLKTGNSRYLLDHVVRAGFDSEQGEMFYVCCNSTLGCYGFHDFEPSEELTAMQTMALAKLRQQNLSPQHPELFRDDSNTLPEALKTELKRYSETIGEQRLAHGKSDSPVKNQRP